MTSRHSSLLVATGVLALLSSPVLAADDGYQDVFSSVVTAVGLMKPDAAPEIDYRERAPLVLPPKMDLPAPSAEISHPVSWPKDPDVTRRIRAAQEGRAPSENLLGNRRQLMSRDEAAKGRTDTPSPTNNQLSTCGWRSDSRNCLIDSPDKLKAEGEHYAANNPDAEKPELKPGEEPDRMYLTQPPKGYMTTTKTVKLTHEAPRTYHDESNPAAQLVYKPKPDDE